MMIETCADIAGHIISDRGYRVPTSYADTFRVLYERRFWRKDSLKQWKRYQNLEILSSAIMNRIDPEIVVNILRKDLDDFLVFKNTIITLLTK